ncbi:MAG: LCP family protein [Cellulosilyticaceae bacterium]
MSKNKAKLKKKQRARLMKMFLRIAAITLVVCLVAIGSLVGCYNRFFKEDGGSTTGQENGKWGLTGKDSKKDINKTLAVFGVDKDGYRTDVIFVVNFNSETNKVKVVSLPRDTKVSWTDEQRQKLSDHGKGKVYTSKLNEMTSYGGIDNVRDFTIDEIENILGIKVDNYVLVTIDAFKEIVDAIGGVDMYVPQSMYYQDKAGGLYINLKEGQQHLTGEQAEGLVRFRRYPRGDEDRIVVQQAFLDAFADKVLSPSVITKIPKLINVLFSSIKTDVDLVEIPQYYTYMKEFDSQNLSFYTIPGAGRYERGVSYFFPDMNEMGPFVEDVFFDTTKAGEEPVEEEIITDKTVSIEVLNGSGVTGAASKSRDTLQEAGYVVSSVGNYSTQDVAKTMIYAKDKSLAKQFETFYPKATIEQNTSLSYDIQIVLGIDE